MRRLRIPALLALPCTLLCCGEPADPARDPDGDRADIVDVAVADAGTDDDAADGAVDVVTPDTDSGVDIPEVIWDQTFTVATWNVARFFDTTCDSGRCGADAFEEIPSAAQFRVKVATVADAVASLNADIVLLQEVESAACLDALVEALDGEYPIAILGETGGAASLDVAVLARGELIEVVRHADAQIPRPGGGTTTFAREFLEVRLLLGETSVSVFNAHFKSQSGDDPSRRLAEALAAHQIVVARAEAAPEDIVLLGGDLNDVPGSEPMDALLADGALLRVAEELVPDDGTVEYRGVRNALDHLLISTRSAGVFVPGSAEVVRDRSPGYRGSDHSPLRAGFGVARSAP